MFDPKLPNAHYYISPDRDCYVHTTYNCHTYTWFTPYAQFCFWRIETVLGKLETVVCRLDVCMNLEVVISLDIINRFVLYFHKQIVKTFHLMIKMISVIDVHYS